ncbi:methyltransferase [Histoplasma capsulatum var. duboisii H88]|uniref:Methyltransferase n=1 Tax=Ajellomyces capsulatus (strain H88) TaxID=544711 RepID=A0A8A1LE20_AJEC8|nr:methyltransferase [Histoplasma capsulatum var. duboisii H88]
MAEVEAPHAVPAPPEDRDEENVVVDPAINDSDSTYGDELSVYTASVTSSVTNYQRENGRRYHAYKEGRYLFPNDERENDRLDMHHALIRVVMKDRLFFSPIGDSPGRVIDLCTGTGIWAIEFADLFPSAEIIGNDLSPIQPKLVPPNVKFIIDDVEDEWGYENDPFDFIHARYLTGTLKNMPRLLEQSFACLKPGGWAEFQDWDAMVQSADDSTKGTSIEQYFLNTLPAFESAGYSTRPGRYLEKWMKDAGFVNIQVHKHTVPLGTWAKDKRYVYFPCFASSPPLFLFSIATNISMDS